MKPDRETSEPLTKNGSSYFSRAWWAKRPAGAVAEELRPHPLSPRIDSLCAPRFPGDKFGRVRFQQIGDGVLLVRQTFDVATPGAGASACVLPELYRLDLVHDFHQLGHMRANTNSPSDKD